MITASKLTYAGAVWLATAHSKLKGQKIDRYSVTADGIGSNSLSCSKRIWFGIALLLVQ